MKISTLWLIVMLLGICEQQIESAVVPPPWSDPYSNPCATQPGGWQLLYWPPLKKCFKIFTVRVCIGVNEIFLKQIFVFLVGLSVSGHNGIESSWK